MKLQGKKTGALADFIGYIDQATPTIDMLTGKAMLTVRYKDAGANCYKDYKTIAEFNADWEDYAEPAEPEPAYLVAKIQKLENSVKALDERLKAVEKKHGAQAPDNNVGTAKLKFMKQILREWIEKEPKVEYIVVNFVLNKKANDGRRGVQFIDFSEKRSTDYSTVIWDWPWFGLVDGAIYKPDELLSTGEEGKE